jgi:hypothetical protein
LDKSNWYFSESIGRGRDEYETFFSQEKLLPGGKGPSENPADIGPGELFSGDDGSVLATDTIGKQVTAPSVAISNDVKAEQVLADSLAKINHKVQVINE